MRNRGKTPHLSPCPPKKTWRKPDLRPVVPCPVVSLTHSLRQRCHNRPQRPQAMSKALAPICKTCRWFRRVGGKTKTRSRGAASLAGGIKLERGLNGKNRGVWDAWCHLPNLAVELGYSPSHRSTNQGRSNAIYEWKHASRIPTSLLFFKISEFSGQNLETVGDVAPKPVLSSQWTINLYCFIHLILKPRGVRV